MKSVIQKVLRASVSVSGEKISSIEKGLCILVGISRSDTVEDIDYMVKKILNTRIFEDGEKRWQKSVKDLGLEILCVSQFTLYHELKGNKLDFHNAMSADMSKDCYDEFIEKLRKEYKPDLVKDGVFGALMQVDIQNDGPVTIVIDSPMNSTRRKSSLIAAD